MKKITRRLFTTSLVLSVVAFPLKSSSKTRTRSKAKIQLAILLDSSNSMDGLIDQTRTQLWRIVNSLSKVTKDGQTPELQVALYHYGNDRLPADKGHLKQLTGFTKELDVISEKLFSIQTDGGEEYVGWTLRSAMQELNWSKNNADFRVVFVAGNEAFDQGPVPWKESVNLAVKADTFVNTIYCGDAEDSTRKLWSEGALLAKGSNFSINQNQQVAVIPSPYDREIVELNTKLNATYIPYGRQGAVGQRRQAVEDQNSAANIAERSGSKTSPYYRNASWDLVDAVEDNVVKLEDIPTRDLPTEMQSMTLAQKRAYIKTKKADRQAIQAKINSLSKQRDAYVAKQRSQQSPQEKTVDAVIIQSLQSQLATKGFKLN
jgi:von Willebrand factor type A domain